MAKAIFFWASKQYLVLLRREITVRNYGVHFNYLSEQQDQSKKRLWITLSIWSSNQTLKQISATCLAADVYAFTIERTERSVFLFFACLLSGEVLYATGAQHVLNIPLTPSQKPFHLATSLESLLNEINRVLSHEMSFSPWLSELISFEWNHHWEHLFPPPRCRSFHASPCTLIRSLIYGSFINGLMRLPVNCSCRCSLLTYRETWSSDFWLSSQINYLLEENK